MTWGQEKKTLICTEFQKCLSLESPLFPSSSSHLCRAFCRGGLSRGQARCWFWTPTFVASCVSENKRGKPARQSDYHRNLVVDLRGVSKTHLKKNKKLDGLMTLKRPHCPKREKTQLPTNQSSSTALKASSFAARLFIRSVKSRYWGSLDSFASLTAFW